MINEKNLINQLKKLVAFETVAGNPAEQKKCLEYIKKQFSFYPFVINEYESNGHPSLVLTTEKTKQPEFFLVAHIDVVPGDKKLFSLQQKGDKLMGRGVYDMKMGVASFICVLETIYEQTKKLPSLGLMFTSEEEIEGNNGVGFLVEKKGYSCKVAFLPDSGLNWQIVKESRGLLHLALTTKGKNAHASTPWVGESAIAKLFKVGQQLQKFYPSTSEKENILINFGKIIGGTAINQVADKATMIVDIRFSKDISQKEIITNIKKIDPTMNIALVDSVPAFSTDITNPYIKHWAKLIEKYNAIPFMRANGATDGPYFAEKGIPVILSKPLGGGQHADDEWISISALLAFSEKLQLFLTK